MRTEFLVVGRASMPDEEEQYLDYRRVTEAFAGRPVVIRTFDVGGDKLPVGGFPSEPNPFLGWRAIRMCLDQSDLFKVAGARLSAQSYRNFREAYAEIQDRTPFRLGPLRLFPEFRLSDVGYDSNVYFQEDGGEAVPDFTATISPLIRGHVLLGRSAILSVMDNPEYLFYAEESELRAFTNSFSTGLRMLLLRSFSLAAEYHDLSHVRRSTPELEQRIRDTTTGGAAELFFETARGTALGFTGSVDDFRYEDIVSGAPDDIYAQSLDRREDSGALEVYYRVFSQSHFFSTVVWKRDDFASIPPTGRFGKNSTSA